MNGNFPMTRKQPSSAENTDGIKIAVIQDLCKSAENSSPVKTDDLKKLINSFKNGKSQDPSHITAEHLKYTGENMLLLLTNVINYMLTSTYIPDELVSGILTPILKKKKDKTCPDNYRGITVTSVFGKLLEKAWLLKADPILSKIQNPMQRGFTKCTSPSNAALLVTESINEAKENKKPMYVTLLDVSKAFDVVNHTILLEELYHAGVSGNLWLTFRQLYQNPSTAIKWNGFLSDNFNVKQGVRQGGVTSAPIYKVYTNRLLDQLTEHHTRHRIGTIKVPAPTCADDMAILSNTQTDTQMALNIVENYSKSHKYKINASKSATVPYSSSVYTELTIDHESIPYSEEAIHLGISRKTNNALDVDERIRRARRAAYALMGAGLHGRNGLPPHVSFHIWVIYVLPRMLYGIEATSFKQSDIDKMEKFQRKILRQLQFLPSSPAPANAAVYGLLGAKPIEALIDTAILTLFGSIIRDTESAEMKIAIRQLAVKSFKSNSWFMKVRKILSKYDLPSIFDLLNNPPTKLEWKASVNDAIRAYWNEEIIADAKARSSLKHLNVSKIQIGKSHQVWSSLPTNPREVEKASIKTRLLTNTYVLQSNRSKFNQYSINDTCLLCKSSPETRCHFLLECVKLDQPRKYYAEKLKEFLLNTYEDKANKILLNPNKTLQLILDSSHHAITDIICLTSEETSYIESISRGWCYSLHLHRSTLLKQIADV